jgi:hypothetical protein
VIVNESKASCKRLSCRLRGRIEPDHVFIIPEQRDLHVLDGEFRLKPISRPRGWPDVITVFLRSLTQYWDGKLIAVIVSGYDGDGAAALCGIKEVGGITIAQKLDTAGQSDMPESAIENGKIILSQPQLVKISANERRAKKFKTIKRMTVTLFAFSICLSVPMASFSAGAEDMKKGADIMMKGSDTTMEDGHKIMLDGYSMMKSSGMMDGKAIVLDGQKTIKK